MNTIEFTKIPLLLETLRKPIGDPSETSTIDMLHWRPPCPIGYRHACEVQSEFKHYQLFLENKQYICRKTVCHSLYVCIPIS